MGDGRVVVGAGLGVAACVLTWVRVAFHLGPNDAVATSAELVRRREEDQAVPIGAVVTLGAGLLLGGRRSGTLGRGVLYGGLLASVWLAWKNANRPALVAPAPFVPPPRQTGPGVIPLTP